MQKHNFKKQFGQNFLKSKRFIEELLDSAEVKEGDAVIEIGPGDGSVTEEILKRGAKVVSIEVDYDLLPKLISKFGENPNFNLVHKDVLEVNLDDLFDNYDLATGVKVVGSLPYNISKKIIRKFVRWGYLRDEETVNRYPILDISDRNRKLSAISLQQSFSKLAFIIQEEVAKDYAANPPQATFLSNFLNIYTNVRKLRSIPASQFYPRPKVNGAILLIEPKLINDVPNEPEKLLKLIKIGFSSPRKTLRKNIKSSNIFHKLEDEMPKLNLQEIFNKLQIKKTARAAELSLGEWINLWKTMF